MHEHEFMNMTQRNAPRSRFVFVTMVQYESSGKVSRNNSYRFDKAFPAQATPPGWGDDLGVRFQMDIGSAGAQMQERVDRVTLITW
jgi:hypothetical protein